MKANQYLEFVINRRKIMGLLRNSKKDRVNCQKRA